MGSSLGSATGQEQPREMVDSVTAAVDPEGTAAGGSTQLTASYSKFSGKELTAATLRHDPLACLSLLVTRQ